MTLNWQDSLSNIDWHDLAELYRLVLGPRLPADLETVFANSRFRCFVFDGERMIGAGRALADGVDCAYICDVALHPDYQGQGIGQQIVSRLLELSRGHRKIILYAAPGKEGFYRQFGFQPMTTAMAIFEDQDEALARGLIAGV
jgi:ribosomal protein S18 acetylase RimI-like enzyme